jgi:hypothetical protein
VVDILRLTFDSSTTEKVLAYGPHSRSQTACSTGMKGTVKKIQRFYILDTANFRARANMTNMIGIERPRDAMTINMRSTNFLPHQQEKKRFVRHGEGHCYHEGKRMNGTSPTNKNHRSVLHILQLAHSRMLLLFPLHGCANEIEELTFAFSPTKWGICGE